MLLQDAPIKSKRFSWVHLVNLTDALRNNANSLARDQLIALSPSLYPRVQNIWLQVWLYNYKIYCWALTHRTLVPSTLMSKLVSKQYLFFLCLFIQPCVWKVFVVDNPSLHKSLITFHCQSSDLVSHSYPNHTPPNIASKFSVLIVHFHRLKCKPCKFHITDSEFFRPQCCQRWCWVAKQNKDETSVNCMPLAIIALFGCLSGNTWTAVANRLRSVS